jgi:hypothetical protein
MSREQFTVLALLAWGTTWFWSPGLAILTGLVVLPALAVLNHQWP